MLQSGAPRWVVAVSNRSRFGLIPNIPPAETEARSCAALETEAMAAYHKEVICP